MTTPHRATPEQWEVHEKWGRRSLEPDIDSSCILELRARIVALEAAQHAHADLSHLSDAEREQMAQELAKPERLAKPPIATDQDLQRIWDSVSCVDFIAALRGVYDLGRQHGSAKTTCPHIVSSDEGTSYCRLAEQGIAPVSAMDELRAASAEARPAVGGRLWERMVKAGYRELEDNPHALQAEFYEATIREVAAWLRTNRLLLAAELLEQEANR